MLLKNANSRLPLSVGKNIAVVGPHANASRFLLQVVSLTGDSNGLSRSCRLTQTVAANRTRARSAAVTGRLTASSRPLPRSAG